MKRPTTLLASILILAAACGSETNVTTTAGDLPTTTTSPPTTTGAPRGNEQGVILQVSYEGGFAPIEFIANRTPAFTLLVDGTILFEGPVAAIFPGPAMPNIQQAALDERTMADILQLIDAIGLPDMTEVRNNDAANFVADATDTVVRYFDANGEHYFSVYALGIGGPPSDPGRQAPDEVLNLGLLVDLLNSAASQAPATQYEPGSLQLVLLEEPGLADPQVANSIAWPFGSLTISDFTSNGFIACTTLDAGVADAMTLLTQANSVTTYELDGAEHRILVRPLLPGERACDVLEN